ncbi:unnamed protein product [Triticum turgidum subsp. durum]|uniref:Leucine-rich repeat-containing N-terminal plant-type domain-containing protein n=1 Tax=Triticum turgidum subsp. durum TaxID=4567 RepID=A0A9R0ZK36_TRITD|nr:unnamed protein product [Triticum turgidum subsp. durum]
MAPRVPSSLLLVGAALLLGLAAGAARASNEEGDALYALRMRLSDPNGVLQSWDPTLVNPCTWFHVTCDTASRVVRLDLGNSNVSGSIGPELSRLVNLQYLELYRNNLNGEIPKELGKLKNLISLDLYANKLTGRIPKSLSKLSSLRFILNSYGNNFPQANTKLISYRRLNNNKLAGSIPRELAKLSNLKVIDLSNNDLCGTIPVDGPFSSFPLRSFENNSRLNGPELQGLVSYDFGC